MMNCQESQREFSPYLDDELTRDARMALDAHLDVCPICRRELDETRSLIRSYSLIARPAAPPNLAAAISHALIIERAERNARTAHGLRERVTRWIEPHLMPYAVGALYSLLLFVGVIAGFSQQLQSLRNLAAAEKFEATLPYQVTWIDNSVGGLNGVLDGTQRLSPENLAASRAPFTEQSPSLNPRGALAKLALSPSDSLSPDDDDMIVVADVYSNGSASLAAIVEPPRNPRMLDELQDALRKNPAFVPASLDRRPQTMRVVFALQKMNVPERSY